MNKEDIIRMAREAGCDEIHASKVLTGLHFNPSAIERFAQLVAAAEREACEQAVEKSRVHQYVWYPDGYHLDANKVGNLYEFQWKRSMDAIRARGQQ